MKRSAMIFVGLGAMLIAFGAVGFQLWRAREGKHGGKKDVVAEGSEQSSVSLFPRRKYSQVALSDNSAAGPDSPGTRSVLDAVKTGKHPERLTPLIAPVAFDTATFEANPQQYLDVVEPGRCFQTLKNPAPNSPYLQPAGPSLVSAQPDETVLLMVKGAPNGPVTFTAFEGGRFAENGLNSVSVRSDARGYASAHFKTPADANGRLPVLAGSPLALGNQTFLVDATIVH